MAGLSRFFKILTPSEAKLQVARNHFMEFVEVLRISRPTYDAYIDALAGEGFGSLDYEEKKNSFSYRHKRRRNYSDYIETHVSPCEDLRFFFEERREDSLHMRQWLKAVDALGNVYKSVVKDFSDGATEECRWGMEIESVLGGYFDHSCDSSCAITHEQAVSFFKESKKDPRTGEVYRVENDARYWLDMREREIFMYSSDDQCYGRNPVTGEYDVKIVKHHRASGNWLDFVELAFVKEWLRLERNELDDESVKSLASCLMSPETPLRQFEACQIQDGSEQMIGLRIFGGKWFFAIAEQDGKSVRCVINLKVG